VSGYQPIGTELLYSNYSLATTSVPAAAAATITAGMPPIVVPAGFFKNLGSWSSSLRLVYGGLMSTAATLPTWNWGLYASVATTAAPAFSAGGILLGQSGTSTPPSAVSNIPWWAYFDIGIRAIALGAASTIVTWGTIQSTAVNAAGEVTIPGSGAYTPPATWDTTQSYVLWPALTLGAATAGNTVTVQYAKLYGEN
jgi:hypothetical protein